ncbi:MAG TPA: prolipoprotein diacylglyceryl transferase family protein [Candidatus Nanopelagicales bacterium]
MYPVLFHLGTLPVPTHEWFTVLGLLVAVGLVAFEARRRGVADRAMATIAVGALLGGAIGARLGNWWIYLVQGGSLTLPGLLVDAGKSVLGGLAGAYAGVVVTKRILGYRARTGDVFAPAVALGLAVGRIGCFLTEQIGTPTSLPWGFIPPAGTLDRIPNCPQCQPGVAMHPSFLYEVAFFVALFAALQWLRPRVLHLPGELFKVFLAAYCVFRFGVEFVRGNPDVALGLSRSQWFLLATGPLIAWYFLRQVRSGAYRSPATQRPIPAVVAPMQGGTP